MNNDVTKFPDGWELKRLCDIAETITKGTTPTTIGFDFQAKGINFIKIESINENNQFLYDMFKFISIECNDAMNRSQLKKNDILFSIAGALGRVAIVTEEILPANINQALSIIRIPEGVVNYRYMYFVLKSSEVLKQFEKQKRGNSQKNLSLEDVRNLLVPVPPIDEQKRIVELIESKINVIEKIKKISAEQGKIIDALFDVYLCNALNKKLLDGWKWRQLSDICTEDKVVIVGRDSSLPFIGLEMIKSGTGEIDFESQTMDGISNCFYFDDRHILYGKLRPYLNKVAVPGFKGRCSTELVPLFPKEGICREFLAFMLKRKETVEYVMKEKTGSRMPRANVKYLLTMKIPVPPIQEQKIIVNLLLSKSNKIQEIKKMLDEQLHLLEVFPQSIFRQAFQGQL